MPPEARHWSLNGVRVFESAARLRSLKGAATELGVTASAVSHQIRHLEAELGRALFIRKHNTVELTAEGAQFFRDVGPAIKTIMQARQALQRSSGQVVIKVSPSLGMRWLIPRLQAFRHAHPGISMRVDMANLPITLGPDIDLALAYVRDRRQALSGRHFLADRSQLVCSPALLEGMRHDAGVEACLSTLPAIAATADDWDWNEYCAVVGFDPARLRIAARFDTDHAAIGACIGGLGLMIAPRAFIEEEFSSGTLVAVPGAPLVSLGDYWLMASTPLRHEAAVLLAWVQKQAAAAVQ